MAFIRSKNMVFISLSRRRGKHDECGLRLEERPFGRFYIDIDRKMITFRLEKRYINNGVQDRSSLVASHRVTRP